MMHRVFVSVTLYRIFLTFSFSGVICLKLQNVETLVAQQTRHVLSNQYNTCLTNVKVVYG